MNTLFKFLNHAVQKCWIKSTPAIPLKQVKNQMSNGKRSIGLFGVSGVLVAALIIAAFVAMGGIFQAQGKATLTIKVMDEPIQLDHLYLTVDGIRMQNVDGGWVDLELKAQSISFDLLALKSTETAITLSEVIIEAGDYSMIQIHLLAASTKSLEGVELRIPSNVTKVLLQPNLHLEGGTESTMLIDLQFDDPNSIAQSNSLNLRPVIKAVVQNSGS